MTFLHSSYMRRGCSVVTAAPRLVFVVCADINASSSCNIVCQCYLRASRVFLFADLTQPGRCFVIDCGESCIRRGSAASSLVLGHQEGFSEKRHYPMCMCVRVCMFTYERIYVCLWMCVYLCYNFCGCGIVALVVVGLVSVVVLSIRCLSLV